MKSNEHTLREQKYPISDTRPRFDLMDRFKRRAGSLMGRILIHLRQYNRETFASLYIRNYRLYYFGQIISTSGTFMQSVAQAWLVLKLTNSGFALGFVSTLQYLPFLVLGPYGGVIADRFPKQKILYFTQSIAGLLALSLGVSVATGRIQVSMVYALALCLGMVTVFDNPA